MKPNILVIDDEYSIRKLLEYFLEDKYNVVSIENAKEAIYWLNESNIPDVILLDQDMPELNGKEFLKMIAHDSTLSDVPIMMLTGIKEIDNKIECLNLGADDYIVKPFNPIELENKIDNACKKHFHEIC